MKYSQLFGKTIKETPKDATLVSHKLLYRAGFIRESTAGRYYHLPLGLRVMQNIKKVIKEEMDASGAQEMIAPVLHPKVLWEETNRTNSVGFELMSIKDRNETEFVLGGTAEEMLVDLVRKFQLSYKDLPFNLYQFSTKFRDEMRARGGLLRLREFVMKDGYSFHATEEDFKIEYEKMKETYSKIYKRLELKTAVVESDNGYIGGEYCHEFIVESGAGESKYFTTEDGSYAAHEDVAVFERDDRNTQEELQKMHEVDAERGTTMEDGVKFHDMPLWQQIKDVLFVDERGRFILAIIRGDYDVNEVKLMHITKSYTLRHATEEEIREKIHSEPGFISPVGIKDLIENGVELMVVADYSLKTIHNAYGGANKKNKDLLNVNIDRDYQPDKMADIALAQSGYTALNGQQLIEKRGIEVGNIFQLGFHYTSKMAGATFQDANGEKKPYYMGCYGIGLDRTLATIAEIHNDDRGLIWPENLAPYQVELIVLGNKKSVIPAEAGIQEPQSEDKPQKNAELIYKNLKTAGVTVLFDDRDVSAGEKFADADLIGLPYRLVVSAKTGDQVEVKKRTEKETELMSIDEFIEKVGSKN